MVPKLRSFMAATLLFLLPAVAAAEQKWMEVRTPNFVVVANTGEGTARDVGWQFEQVRHVFRTLWPWARRESGRPFVVFVVRSEGDVKALAPSYWEEGRDGTVGVAVEGRDKDYVVLQAGISLSDDLGTNPYFYAYWGYANRVLDASFPVNLPPWYKRGLSDLFGNTIVRGKDVQVGRLMTTHLRTLGKGQRVPLAELIAANWDSKVVRDDGWRPMFDAEAWMFAHYLVFGEKGAHGPKMNRFADLMRDGRKADEAFKEAFGELAPLEKGFNQYLDRQLFGFAQIQLDLNVKKEGFEARPLTPAASAARRAAFHVAMGRSKEARALIEEARKTEASSVIATEAEALLLDREDKDAEALAAYTRAAEAGSDNFWVHYRRALLLWRQDAPKDVQALRAKALAEAVRLNPDHAWSQAELARVLSDLEPGERAVAAAMKAVSLQPSVPSRLALIGALWNASRIDEAKKQAAAALALSSDAEDRRKVQKWIDYMNRPAIKTSASDRQFAPGDAGTGADAGAATDWIPVATKACDAGNAGACDALASALERGAGVARDPVRALALFEKSCASSELRACVAAARMKIGGKGVPRDVPGARTLAQKACDAGELAGCTTLAVAYVSAGTTEGVAKARALLAKACDGGERNACDLLASMPK